MGAGIALFRILVREVGRACDRHNATIGKTPAEKIAEEKYTAHKLEVGRMSKQQIANNQTVRWQQEQEEAKQKLSEQVRWQREQAKTKQELSKLTYFDKFMFVILLTVVAGLLTFSVCMNK